MQHHQPCPSAQHNPRLQSARHPAASPWVQPPLLRPCFHPAAASGAHSSTPGWGPALCLLSHHHDRHQPAGVASSSGHHTACGSSSSSSSGSGSRHHTLCRTSPVGDPVWQHHAVYGRSTMAVGRATGWQSRQHRLAAPPAAAPAGAGGAGGSGSQLPAGPASGVDQASQQDAGSTIPEAAEASSTIAAAAAATAPGEQSSSSVAGQPTSVAGQPVSVADEIAIIDQEIRSQQERLEELWSSGARPSPLLQLAGAVGRAAAATGQPSQQQQQQQQQQGQQQEQQQGQLDPQQLQQQVLSQLEQLGQLELLDQQQLLQLQQLDQQQLEQLHLQLDQELQQRQLQQQQLDQPDRQPDQPLSLDLPGYMRPWITWAMCGWAWVALVLQWWPLAGPLLAAPRADLWDLLVLVGGVALLVPSTPVATYFQMDLMSWASNAWTLASVGASCMYGGVLPTLIFTRGLLHAGSVIEQAYGPLVMMMHVALAAWGAALGQRLLGMAPQTITGPAVVCGLYAGMAVLLAREQRLLRKQQEGAKQPKPAAAAAAAASGTGSSSSTSSGGSSSSSGGGGSGGRGSAPVEDPAVAEVLLGVPVVSRGTIAMWGLALALACFQPMLGVGGVLGGTLGGLLASLTCFRVVAALRWVLTRSVSSCFLVLAWVVRLPLVVLQYFVGLIVVVAGSLQDTVKGMRRM